jgi:urease
MRPMFAPLVPSTSVVWVSQASIDNGMVRSYGLRKRVEAVKNCRNITKSDMKYNDLMPKMRVDPESYVSFNPVVVWDIRWPFANFSSQLVEADGVVCKAEPADSLPLTQSYFVY